MLLTVSARNRLSSYVIQIIPPFCTNLHVMISSLALSPVAQTQPHPLTDRKLERLQLKNNDNYVGVGNEVIDK